MVQVRPCVHEICLSPSLSFQPNRHRIVLYSRLRRLATASGLYPAWETHRTQYKFCRCDEAASWRKEPTSEPLPRGCNKRQPAHRRKVCLHPDANFCIRKSGYQPLDQPAAPFQRWYRPPISGRFNPRRPWIAVIHSKERPVLKPDHGECGGTTYERGRDHTHRRSAVSVAVRSWQSLMRGLRLCKDPTTAVAEATQAEQDTSSTSSSRGRRRMPNVDHPFECTQCGKRFSRCVHARRTTGTLTMSPLLKRLLHDPLPHANNPQHRRGAFEAHRNTHTGAKRAPTPPT